MEIIFIIPLILIVLYSIKQVNQYERGKLAKTAGGLHVRTLQTLSELSADKNNTIVFVTPLEILRAFEGLVKKGSTR